MCIKFNFFGLKWHYFSNVITYLHTYIHTHLDSIKCVLLLKNYFCNEIVTGSHRQIELRILI